MRKKRATPAKLPPEIEEAPDLESHDPLEKLLTAFDADEAGKNYTARVYRLDGASKNGMAQPYLFTLTPEEVIGVQDKLRDEYGTGQYLIRIFRDGKFSTQVSYQIEAPPKTAATAAAPNSVTEVMSAVREMLAEFREEHRRTQPVVPAAPVDALTMLEKVFTLQAAMQNSQRQIEPAANGGEKMIEVLIKGMELGQSTANGGAGSDSMGAILLEIAKQPGVGEKLVDVMTSVMAGRGVPALPPPTPRPGAPATAKNPMLEMLQFLAQHANKRSDPGLYAEYFLDNVPPDICAQLLALPNADLIAQMTGMVPDIGKQPEWFNQFIDAARRLTEPEGDSERDGGKSNGNPSDPPGST